MGRESLGKKKVAIRWKGPAVRVRRSATRWVGEGAGGGVWGRKGSGREDGGGCGLNGSLRVCLDGGTGRDRVIPFLMCLVGSHRGSNDHI